MAINRAFSILSDIYWEGVSDTTDPILNPISYREKEFDDEKKDKSHILKMPFYKELKDKGYNYFYRGKGVPDDQVWLFGIRIEDEELALYVAEGY